MRDVNVTGVTYIRNAYVGAFCVFESIASMLPFVDDVIVLDFGSTDGTLDTLRDICSYNSRISLETRTYSDTGVDVLARAANECVSLATHDNVLLWQADEIWHQHLLSMMVAEFAQGQYDMAFWRVQLSHNFQDIYWWPHRVHRVGPKSNFVFIEDAMNSNRKNHVPMCSSYGGDWRRWQSEYDNPLDLPMHEMILDVGKCGGFLGGSLGRAVLHAPMWDEYPNIRGEDIEPWHESQKGNPQWTLTDTAYDIPHIMRRHLGRHEYVLDDDVLEALKRDCTIELLGMEHV